MSILEEIMTFILSGELPKSKPRRIILLLMLTYFTIAGSVAIAAWTYLLLDILYHR